MIKDLKVLHTCVVIIYYYYGISSYPCIDANDHISLEARPLVPSR